MIWHSDGLHVEHLGSRELISVLDWALTDFLVTDSIAHRVFYSLFVLSDTVEFVTLESVLVSLLSIKERLGTRRYIQIRNVRKLKLIATIKQASYVREL